jgi:hypothetical protein
MNQILLTLVFFLSLSAHGAQTAGVMTEPYAGYFTGETSGANIGKADIKSYGYGARLGYQTESGWNFGIDYSQGKGDYEPSAGETLDFTSKDGGIFIGYSFPEYVKVWASYIFKHEATIKEFSAGTDAEFEGDGFNVGIGIRGIPFVTVNLSYQERKYDKLDSQSLAGSDNKIKLTLLSLSLPYNFPWKP